MEMLIQLLTRFGDKISSLGALVSAMGCAMCFPAIASLGAAVGLGFLSQWEGLFVNTLLPLFAWIALVLNGLGWFSHRQWHRSALGVVGPILLLLSLYPFFPSYSETQGHDEGRLSVPGSSKPKTKNVR